MTTGATLFSGGELVGVGMRNAGIVHLWGIEIDDDIASVARMNGFHTITADVLDMDPATLERPDVLHASPVCTRASVANQGADEAELDILAAEKTAEFIDVLKPDVFTLENVYPYRNFKSFGIICKALERNGYWYDYAHLNSADFGVPQTRRRLILRARLGALLPPLPPPEPWVGWYEAIADLVDGLPDSKFAPWQLKRLPDELTTALFAQSKYDDYLPRSTKYEPVLTVTANTNQLRVKAYLVTEQYRQSNDSQDRYPQTFGAAEPAATVMSGHRGKFRAYLVDGKLNGNSTRLTISNSSDPAFTVTTSHNNRDVKAWLVGNGDNYRPVVNGQVPSPTVSSSNGAKALLTDYSNTSRRATQLQGDQPSMTVSSWHGRRKSHMPDAAVSGRVVQMTPRALARFQSIPDWYRLPQKASLAVKIIGNAVPPLMYEKIIRQLVRGI